MNGRYDERDTVFSRMFELHPGTAEYDRYYDAHPEREEQDRKLREHTGGVFADRAAEQSHIDSVFGLISELRQFAGHGSGGREGADALELSPSEASRRLKKAAESLGALKTGIAPMDRRWVYSVRGRGRHYGKAVSGYLPNIIVFAVEMDEAAVNRAPAVEESVEVVHAYLRAAVTALAVKRIINGWGYRAVCHMDGESEVVMPPAAEAAGLGSIGLHGLLVTPEAGPRVRLSAVSTDLPLEPDSGSKFTVRNFCRSCGKCAEICPSESIRPYGAYQDGERFVIDHESCFGLWREMATDCGVCLAACPFSHPKNGRQKRGGGGEAEGGPHSGFLKDLMFGRG